MLPSELLKSSRRAVLVAMMTILVVCITAYPMSALDRQSRSFLYVSLQGEDCIAIYRIDRQSGDLDAVDFVTISGEPACLTTDPNHCVMYVAQRSAQTISAYKINPRTGRLSFLNTIRAHNPVYLATDRSGRFLLAAYNQRFPGMGQAMKAAIYPLAPDGRIENATVQEIITGKKPHAIQVDRSNRFLYIPNTDADQIQQFRFNPHTGRATACDPGACKRPTWVLALSIKE